MTRRLGLLAAGLAWLVLSSALLPPLIAAPPTTQVSPTTDPSSWDDIDQRMIFFTVQLASVETSIDACNKALKAAGYKISLRADDAARYQKGNELMDRNAGGPVRWDEFYGRTAEKFFYNPAAAPGTLRLTVSVLHSGHGDMHEAAPIAQRPPQFDYIYRANANQEAQAQADIAKLAGKTDQLLARRRQLEAEQSGLWCKIAFRPVAGKELLGKPLYRFDLKTTDTGANAAQDLAAMQAAMDFLRVNNKLIESAEKSVDTDQAGFVAAFTDDVAGSRTAFDAALMKQPAIVMDAYDPHTTIGKLEAVTKRMNDVAKNVADAYKLALDGDAAGDDQRKDTFRAQLQESLMIYAEAVLAGDECVTQLAKEWKVEPNLEKAAVDTPPPAPTTSAASANRAAEFSPLGSWKKLDTGTIYVFSSDGTLTALVKKQVSGTWMMVDRHVHIHWTTGEGELDPIDANTLDGPVHRDHWRLIKIASETKGPDPTAQTTDGASALPAAKDENFSITAAGNWQKTVDVAQGQNLLITATGTWNGSPSGPRSSLGADGLGEWYYLEGRIGENGTPFKVGSQLTTTASDGGMLYLRMKDGNFNDNSGALSVSIRLAAASARPAPVPGAASTAAFKLNVNARIDAKDVLTITQTGATWVHKAAKLASEVTLNGVPWDLTKSKSLTNDGQTKFLPVTVDFSSARLTKRSGRGNVTMETTPASVVVSFADNANGSAVYDLDIEFGSGEKTAPAAANPPSADAAVIPPLSMPAGAQLVSARWGGGSKWADVTPQVSTLLTAGANFRINGKVLASDPTPGWKKRLQIAYESGGKTFKKSMNEGSLFRVTQSPSPAGPPVAVKPPQGGAKTPEQPAADPSAPSGDAQPPNAPEDANEKPQEITKPTTIPAGKSIFDF